MPGRFPYEDIVEELRASILDGRLDSGERLPSENELAGRYATRRPTVRKAIALLKAEGLVTTEQGRGVFVRSKPQVRLLLSGESVKRHRHAWPLRIQRAGGRARAGPEQRLLEVARVPATEEVAQRLGTGTEASVVVRRRLFVVNGEPVARCDSYYPAEMADGTAL